MSEAPYQFVADISDIPPGGNRAFDVGGESVLVCRVKDEFFAVENVCSHAMSPLEGGRMRSYLLICPLHGSGFDVRTGTNKGKPAYRPIRTFPLRIVDARIEVLVEEG